MFGTYEDWLSSEFKRNNGGFAIHCMTKMGKTSMVERALDGAGKSALTIERTTVDTLEDFYSFNCSSLVWSAYMYASKNEIDLDNDGGPGVYPDDVRDSPVVEDYE